MPDDGIPNETWREIPGFPLYEVSDIGNVRSWRRNGLVLGQRLNGPRPLVRRESPRPLRPMDSNGYLAVGLWAKGSSNAVRKKVHELVLLAFVGERPNGMHICHGNGIPTDNRLLNLRYDTRKANQGDMVKHGRSQRGEKSPFAVLTEAGVVAMREEWARSPTTYKAIGERFGVSRMTARRVILRQTWAYVQP